MGVTRLAHRTRVGITESSLRTDQHTCRHPRESGDPGPQLGPRFRGDDDKGYEASSVNEALISPQAFIVIASVYCRQGDRRSDRAWPAVARLVNDPHRFPGCCWRARITQPRGDFGEVRRLTVATLVAQRRKPRVSAHARGPQCIVRCPVRALPSPHGTARRYQGHRIRRHRAVPDGGDDARRDGRHRAAHRPRRRQRPRPAAADEVRDC